MEDWREIDEVINCNIYRERKKLMKHMESHTYKLLVQYTYILVVGGQMIDMRICS